MVVTRGFGSLSIGSIPIAPTNEFIIIIKRVISLNN